MLNHLLQLLIKKYPYFTGCAACPQNIIPWRETGSSLPEPDFPIDFVFTWVDGSEPGHVKKKTKFLGETQGDTSEYDPAHSRNNDELQYALRSIERYAPWYRNIFIVTDAQVPSWFRLDHPRARIVDHTECIPESFLPTFSSRVIEAHIHRIQGLSEHFVYCNDDFFLINTCTPADFFSCNGLPYIFTDWRQSRRLGYFEGPRTPHASSFHNARRWLETHGVDPAPEVIVAHIPYPMTVSNMEAAYAFYHDAVLAIAKQKFRSDDGIVFPCHAVPLWTYAMKRAVPRDMPYYYMNTRRFDRLTYYEAMLREKNLGTLPPFLCLNDVGEAPRGHTWKEDMRRFLTAFFPDPSSFEAALPPAGQ